MNAEQDLPSRTSPQSAIEISDKSLRAHPGLVLSVPDKVEESLARDVVCVFGFPIDRTNLESLVSEVEAAAQDRRSLNIVTPNLNFATISATNRDFRDSVRNADICVADGMPFVWCSRLLGAAIPARVAGSDLFAYLFDHPMKPKLRMFFFGGKEGVAAQASLELNNRSKGLIGVGAFNPGFGALDDLDSGSAVASINASGADFVSVSLGAQKGLEWIDTHQDKLQPPLIAHLGTVVNIAAKSEQRAPIWMQKRGLEWLWRARHDPTLFPRYLRDLKTLINTIVLRIAPYRVARRFSRRKLENPLIAKCTVDARTGAARLKVVGPLCSQTIGSFKKHLSLAASLQRPVQIDLGGANFIDSEAAGTLILFQRAMVQAGKSVELANANSRIRRLLKYLQCLEILDKPISAPI